MTARYRKNTRPAAQHHRDCKCQLKLEAAALICATKVTGNTNSENKKNTFPDKIKSSYCFEHTTHACS